MKNNITGALSLLLSLGCHNSSSIQPTAKPNAPSWKDAESVAAGTATLPCGGLGGIAADPASYSWMYIEPKSACMLHSLPLNKSKPKDLLLGPTRDCGLVSEVGDLTAAPAGAEKPAFFYLLGSLSVKKVVDESGGVSFDSGTANLLFQVDSQGAVRSVDTDKTLRAALFAELGGWNQELENTGLRLEQTKKALVLSGLAATPEGEFLLSFSAPRICPADSSKAADCRAIVMLVSDLASLFPTDDKPLPKLEVKAHATLYLGGAGISSLEYEPLTEGFLVTSSEQNQAYLLRYQTNLTSVTMRPIPLPAGPSGAKLRAVVPAPGGAAALFTQDADSCPASRLSWSPLSLQALDGVERSDPSD